MAFPGAETIKAGIIGVDCFLSWGDVLLDFLEPLILVFSISSMTPFVVRDPLMRGSIPISGDVEGLLSAGVSICTETVVLELDRE